MRALLSVALLLACERERLPPPPMLDGGTRPDAGRFDAGPIVRRDAGPPATIDGIESSGEWDDAVVVEAAVETDREGSTLSRLMAFIEGDRLFVAIEGSLASGDAIILYADRALGEGIGVIPPELADADGALDVALAQTALSVPSAFEIDFAWGTTLLPRTAVGEDAAIGWRDVATDPAAFSSIAGEDAPAVCSATFCETSIALETLGGDAPRTIALFARLVSASGFTNQTLPEDDPLAPSMVSQLLLVPDGEELDGGMPDAGMIDAGPSPITIDGVIGAGEWSAATPFTSSTVAAAPFTGNALRSLRVIRDDVALYVAIEATLTSGNAILMYVDRDVGGPFGAVTPLDDFVGALDRALSKTFSAPELRIDAAWGTLDMSRATMSTDDRMGWRDVGTDPSLYSPLAGASACSASACEIRIALSALGAGAADEIGLFVRLGSASSDTFSNQTLPMDAAAATVTAYASR